jgi:hypothetical protein
VKQAGKLLGSTALDRIVLVDGSARYETVEVRAGLVPNERCHFASIEVYTFLTTA